MSLTYGFTLGNMTISKQFSDALRAVVGDGISMQGGKFNVTINGFTATLASGYAFVDGRWIENDEPLRLAVQPPNRNDDRTDALVARVDYTAKKVSLEVLVDVDQDKIRDDPSILRNDDEYSVFLYFIRVRRGVTSLAPDDIADARYDGALCGKVVPLSNVAGNVIYIYRFLVSGIDDEVARLIDLSEQVYEKADAAIAELDKSIQRAGGAPEIGDLLTSRSPPSPENEWLLCNGRRILSQYPDLIKVTGGTLPNISKGTDRYRTYIYSGSPTGPVPPPESGGIVGEAVVGESTIGEDDF